MTDFKKEYVDLLWLGMEGSSQCTTIKHISRIEMFVSLICVCFGFCFCGFPSGVFSCLVAKSKFYDCASVSFFFVEWHIKLLFLLREWLLAKATNTLFLYFVKFTLFSHTETFSMNSNTEVISFLHLILHSSWLYLTCERMGMKGQGNFHTLPFIDVSL